MEINDENFRTLAQYLQQTLNPDQNVRRPAEKFLESIEVNQNYPILLLHLIDKDDVDMTIRIACSITFKNYIKRNWAGHLDNDGPDRIHETDRIAIKSFIITLMLKAPASVQKQLSDAVSIIGKHDFPKKWPQLIEEIVQKFSTGDFYVINGVLQTAHSLFKRYRYEFKSQDLWEEIKLVLDMLAKPLTDLLCATLDLARIHETNESAIKIIYNSLVLVCKVFYSLNYQDLPEFFEDNMQIWMTSFLKLLTVNIPCLITGEDEEAGVIEQLRSQICDNVGMYAQKYDEEFGPYMPQFVTSVWELLCNTGIQTKYDSLVSNALHFLSIVAERNHYKHLFEDPVLLASICEKVVIPNMDFRISDEELFEDNAEEYIRRDIEGSDVDTRRRSACDLVKTLSQKFEQKIFAIFGEYIYVLLKKYAVSPAANWRAKDTVVFLVTSMAARGGTQKHGVTQSSQLVPLPKFCREEILPELERQNINELPVLKADAIKFIMTFRSIIGIDIVGACIPQLIRHLQSESIVVHSYAACAIDKILIMRGSDGNPSITKEQLTPFSAELLNNLFGVLMKNGSTENEYIMKAIMRSFSTLQEASLPFMGVALPRLTEILQRVSKNPSKPHFNHFLFETLSLAIKIVCKVELAAVGSFEEVLFPVFQGILQQDVLEFVPYVFQILSLLLEVRESIHTIPDPYWELFPCLLSPELWERSGNVTPLIRLICAFIKLGADKIVALDKLNPILGVFQKLIASRNNDHEGFYLLQHLIIYYPSASLQPVMRQVFCVLLQRLTSSKTTKYIRGIIIFFCFYAAKVGASQLVEMIDSIQKDMFGMVIERLFIPDMGKVSLSLDKKIVAIGITKILCECPAIFTTTYINSWPTLLQSLVQTFELPTDDTTVEGDHFIEIEDTPGYQAAYSQLNFAQQKRKDLFVDIQDPRMFLSQNLGKLSQSRPGEITTLINRIPDAHKEALRNYCAQYGVQIV